MNKKNETSKKGFKVLSSIFAILVLFIIALNVLAFIMVRPNISKIKDGVFCRNLDYYTWLLKDKDNPAPLQENGVPISRVKPWDSELPKLIKLDMEYAKEHEYNIQYTFNGNNIYIRFDTGEAELSVNDGIRKLSNFSMYFSEEQLMIYGFSYELSNKEFLTTTIKRSDEKAVHSGWFSTLTYNLNIPFNVDSYIGILADDIGEYSVYVEQEEPEKISIWKDGEKLNAITFPKKVKYNEPLYGFIVTEDNEIYLSFLKIENQEKPDLDYVYVGKVDDCLAERNYLSNGYHVDSFKVLYAYDEYDVIIPIYIIKGEYYTICPEDWKDYIASSTASRKILNQKVEKSKQHKVKFIKLENYFESAEFYFNSNSWIANIEFYVNGKMFVYNLDIGGYDKKVKPNNEEIAEYQKKVYTINEFWNHIDKIRNTYKKYYDYK